MESKPKFLIIPNKHVVEYAEMISTCISNIHLEVTIDMRFDLKLEQRLKNSESFIVIAVGKRNSENRTLQVRLDNQIQVMTFENFIKFTLVLMHT
jgi:hypothetical protein